MKSLFLPASLKILESLTFTDTLFAFDYDGTLSRIVDHPSQAAVTRDTMTLLHDLSSLATVAILSGRSLGDLKRRLTFAPNYLIGNHGLEGLATPGESLDLAKNVCRKWMRRLLVRLGGTQRSAGLEIEDKTYSIAVHYRKSRAKKDAKLEILNIVSDLTPPPRIVMGKCIVNVLPPGTSHKGIALVELMQELEVQSAFFIGDDDTDEDVFALPDSRIFTVRVGHKQNSRAQYFIPRQSDLARVLRLLIGFHRKDHAA